jgi:hypothetical protein
LVLLVAFEGLEVSSRGRCLGGSSLDLEFSSLSFRFRGSTDCDFLILSAVSPFPEEEEAAAIGSDASADCALDDSATVCFVDLPFEELGLDVDEDLVLEFSDVSGPF